MYSLTQRANQLAALATSVALCLVAIIAATSLIIPNQVERANLEITDLSLIYGRSPRDRYEREREYVFTKFDLDTDLTPLFNWNTKQLFIYLTADYDSKTHLNNHHILWDRIVRRPRDAKISLKNAKNKYAFREVPMSGGGKGLSNLTASFSLSYSLMPKVGFVTQGEIVRIPNYKPSSPGDATTRRAERLLMDVNDDEEIGEEVSIELEEGREEVIRFPQVTRQVRT